MGKRHKEVEDDKKEIPMIMIKRYDSVGELFEEAKKANPFFFSEHVLSPSLDTLP